MNLVIQGEEVETSDLKELHRIAHGEAIERISEDAFRITKADPATKPDVAAHCANAKLDFGFVFAYSNSLVVEHGKLAGSVTGDLVDAQAKAAHVARLKRELGIPRERVMAIGDGANDLPMMAEAGTSIAYHAKPVVKEKAG